MRSSVVNRERLRFALRWASLSQNQAAKLAGLLPQRITDDLAGRRPLPDAQVKALAAALGVEASWLDPPAAEPAPAPVQPAPTHPVAGMLRPIRSSLVLLTWGEALVLYRALRRTSQHGDGVDGDVSRSLLQRLLGEIGVDDAAMSAAAEIIGQLSKLA